jgi:hypothetical protein
MYSRPKSSAEILATAKRPPPKKIWPRKAKIERSQPNHYGTISDISSASSSSSRPANVHALNNIYFKDPTTPQKLEAALEIREGRDVMVEKLPDLVGNELPTTRVLLFPLIYETC